MRFGTCNVSRARSLKKGDYLRDAGSEGVDWMHLT
jgi:hypothetical protein